MRKIIIDNERNQGNDALTRIFAVSNLMICAYAIDVTLSDLQLVEIYLLIFVLVSVSIIVTNLGKLRKRHDRSQV